MDNQQAIEVFQAMQAAALKLWDAIVEAARRVAAAIAACFAPFRDAIRKLVAQQRTPSRRATLRTQKMRQYQRFVGAAAPVL